MPLNHVISSSGLADLILILTSDSFIRKEKNTLTSGILNLVCSLLSYIHILYVRLFEGILITWDLQAAISSHSLFGCWNAEERYYVLLWYGCVCLFFFCVGCQEGELKARLCIVLQSAQSIWTTKRNERIIRGWCIKWLHCCVFFFAGDKNTECILHSAK